MKLQSACGGIMALGELYLTKEHRLKYSLLNSSMNKLKPVGYWRDPESGRNYPDPHDLVAPGWLSEEEKSKIIEYLKSAQVCRGTYDSSYCRFEDGPPDNEMGSKELSDGVYVWPEGLWIYVAQYDVKLPLDFIEHIRNEKYKPPCKDLVFSVPVRVDYDYWCQWAIRQISK